MARTTGMLALTWVVLLACESTTTGPEGSGRVEVRFEAAMSGGGQASASMGGVREAVPVTGSNGTLELESIHLIVGELELEAEEGSCPDDGVVDDDDGEEDDDCEEFEVDPFVLDLPLDGSAVTVAAVDVRPGVYTAFEFEVEDVDADEEDDDETALAAALADARALHPDWPDDASMVVEGTFTGTGETEPSPFRTFIEAEIEIESRLQEPLVVEDDGVAMVTVVLDPEVWFTYPDGTVLDLSAYDFTGPGDALLELEVEFEEGVIEVEVDDD